MVDEAKSFVSVFSPVSKFMLTSQWGELSDPLLNPVACATAGSRLYIVDKTRPFVHVFE